MKSPKKDSTFKIRFSEGYKGREIPRSVVLGSKEFVIEHILERKRVQNSKTGMTSEVFLCQMEGQMVRITVQESGGFEIDYL
jgi:hypothetical protein